MMQFKKTILAGMIILAFTACQKDPGPDSLSSHGAQQGRSISACTEVCHSPQSSASPDPLTTNGSGAAGKHVTHVSVLGFACDKCHFNYSGNPDHENGLLNGRGAGTAPVYFDAMNSAGIWTYNSAQQSGTCASTICHGPTTPDWYGAAGWTLPDCSVCHSAPVGARRQVIGASGDFASNPSITSRHVAGASDPTSAQCKVCHSQVLHMTGTVRLLNVDSGATITYDPSLPASLEPFCLSCHDADGAGGSASPFADGKAFGAVPHSEGGKIASYWSGTSVHRNRGLTCAGSGAAGTGCHGREGTINMHGSSNKGLLTASMNFRIPVASAAAFTADPVGSSFSYDNYRLCFDCHAGFPGVAKEIVLGYRQGGVYDRQKAPTPYFTPGMQSLFRDRFIPDPVDFPVYWGGNSQIYNDTMFGDLHLALHNFHLLGFQPNIADPSQNLLQWKYRGDPSLTGRITCTACHNVHGTAAATVRSTYQELQLTPNQFPPVGPDGYTRMVFDPDPLVTEATFSSAPIGCVFTCHTFAGEHAYWHTPSVE